VQYVDRCFNSASLFHKALKEAFESFCNKPVASCQMAQLMADYCNALLKKVRTACDTLSWPRQEHRAGAAQRTGPACNGAPAIADDLMAMRGCTSSARCVTDVIAQNATPIRPCIDGPGM